MFIGKKIIECIEASMSCVESVSVAIGNSADHNAYALLEPDNEEGLLTPVAFYRSYLQTQTPPLGKFQSSILAQLAELEDAWGELFDAIGQRLPSSKHTPLRSLKKACRTATELLVERFNSSPEAPVNKEAYAAVESFCSCLVGVSEAIREEKPIKNQKGKKRTAKRFHDSLTQEDVANDFGVSRQTVGQWEENETENGPYNKSNQFGYYKDLRLNPDLRGAYYELVQVVKMYRGAQSKAKNAGKRFRIKFERFNEQYAKHNPKTNIR